jgi:peroxiredoxin
LQLTAGSLALLLAVAVRAMGPGDAAPDFALTTFDGKTLHLADFRGHLVLLNFWASWCGPCVEEMPRLAAWQRDYGAAGLQVIGVSMDDEAAPVRNFLARHPVDYPIVLGDAQLGERYGGILGLPQSFLIDRRGRIVGRFKGKTALAQLEAVIRSQLREPVASLPAPDPGVRRRFRDVSDTVIRAL